MELSTVQLKAMFPNAGNRLNEHIPYINKALVEGNINTPARIAAFLAQLAHESGEYRYMEEIADGSQYEDRADLGNIYPNDGRTYKGHGPIQITGRANHKACGEALGLDLINNPRLICTPEHGTRAAIWFWNSRKLSLLADVGWFKTITKIINGGTNGLDDRVHYWRNNQLILGIRPVLTLEDEVNSIIDFQNKNGLVADGDAGPRTLKKFFVVNNG